MKVGQRVAVLPEATGYGNPYNGFITNIETMRIHGMLQPFVTVDFDEPTPDGRRGITISNMRLIEQEPQFSQRKAREVEQMIMNVRLGLKP